MYNCNKMVTIEIKENSKQAKAFIALAKTLSFVKFKEGRSTKKHIVSENIPNSTTLSQWKRLKNV